MMAVVSNPPEYLSLIHILPESYDAAVRKLLERERLSDDVRNVLVAHQFFTGSSGEQPETCDSEIFSIGGIDNVCADAVKAFDYVALGHLHGAQRVGEERIRYCGTLLKYSVSCLLYTSRCV